MEYRILGPLEIVDGNWTIEVHGAKPRALLLALLRRPGETVPTEQLLSVLWGDDPPATAASALNVFVAQLCRALGPDAIRRRSSGYAVIVDRSQVDLARFEDLVEEARDADPVTAVAKLQEALALWRGEPEWDAAGLAELRRVAAARLEEALAARNCRAPQRTRDKKI